MDTAWVHLVFILEPHYGLYHFNRSCVNAAETAVNDQMRKISPLHAVSKAICQTEALMTVGVTHDWNVDCNSSFRRCHPLSAD